MRTALRSLLGLSLALGLAGVSLTASAQTTTRVSVPPPPPVTTPVTAGTTASIPAPTDGRVVTATAETDSEIRQREEASRIDAGVRMGSIDAREGVHLTRAMANLQAYQERAYADGVLTLREQARLSRLHARIDRAITRALAR